jgi:rubrerythrin
MRADNGLEKVKYLTKKDLAEIIKLRKQGRRICDIGGLYKICPETMRLLLNKLLTVAEQDAARVFCRIAGRGKALPKQKRNRNREPKEQIAVADRITKIIEGYYCEGCGETYLHNPNRCPHCLGTTFSELKKMVA